MAKMIISFTIVFLLIVCGSTKEMSSENTKDSEVTLWLPNSNKIALGYNPIYGSPVCYSSKCQMDAFTNPIFKLNYRASVPGACTSKLVPDNVNLVCMPMVVNIAETDIVTSLESLQKSITNKIESSPGISVFDFSFGYKKSKETTYMVDTILKNNKTVSYTSTQVSFVKLSMFEPAMELSDNFRHVIEYMPCCKVDVTTREYIRNQLFERYGLMYMPSIVLGGIAQQTIEMQSENYSQLVSQGININKESQVNFFLTMKDKNQEIYNTQTQNTFSAQITSKHGGTLGGYVFSSTINDWAKTVSSNPEVIRFTMKYITDLLTQTRFPNDTNLTKKKKLIEQVLAEYIANPFECINNCTNALQGTCKLPVYLGVGSCECKSGWSGVDCSQGDATVASSNRIPAGTICGYSDGKIMVPCFGQNPTMKCPQGYTVRRYIDIGLTVCFKSVTTIQKSTIGTICGLVNVGSNVDGKIACNHTFNHLQQTCPPGYVRFDYRDSALITVCMSANSLVDLPGTICGMQRLHLTDGPNCDGFNPGLQQCPNGYQYGTWRHSSSNQFSVCYKIS